MSVKAAVPDRHLCDQPEVVHPASTVASRLPSPKLAQEYQCRIDAGLGSVLFPVLVQLGNLIYLTSILISLVVSIGVSCLLGIPISLQLYVVLRDIQASDYRYIF